MATNTYGSTHNVISGYGATNGNDASDDTIAFQNAINAASTEGGGTVYVPSGYYFISNTLSTSNSPGITIRGEGPNSKIIFTASNKDLFSFTLDTPLTNPKIIGLELSTISSSAGTAVSVDYSAYSPPDGIRLRHNSAGLHMEDVIIGVSGSGVWNVGVKLNYSYNSRIVNCTLHNQNQYGIAVLIDNNSTNSIFTDSSISGWNIGFSNLKHTEGILIDNSTIGPVTCAIYNSNGGNSLSYLSITDSVIDCQGVGAIGILANDKIDYSIIASNVFKIAEDAPNQSPSSELYHIAGKFENFTITGGNVFDGNNSAGGVVLMQQQYPEFPTLIFENTFVDIANGATLWIQPTVSNTSVVANGFNGGWFYDQGTNTYSQVNY